jgi:hypothetical protein
MEATNVQTLLDHRQELPQTREQFEEWLAKYFPTLALFEHEDHKAVYVQAHGFSEGFLCIATTWQELVLCLLKL